MSLISRARFSSLRLSPPALAGAGPAPGWAIPDDKDYHKSTYQPSIPDKHFNTSHYNYAPITLWLRSRRPTMEKVGSDLYKTLRSIYAATLAPPLAMWDSALPGFGLKCLGFLGVLLGYNIFAYYVLSYSEAYFNLEKLKLYGIGKGLADSGFFNSESEDLEERMQEYNLKSIELQQLWDDASQAAMQTRDFNKLCEHLTPEAVEGKHLPLREPLSWRFNMMPYGRNSPDVVTFPDNGIDSPKSSLFFWGDIGSTGDYIERVDNKLAILKKARHYYTAAHIPPTK